VLALEVDEGTEHAPVIRAKLARYAAALEDREGWHLIFVAGETERARWLADLARRQGLDVLNERAWVTTIEHLRRDPLEAPVIPHRPPGTRQTIGSLCRSLRQRQTTAPVGSDRWMQMMGSGAGEDFGIALS